MAQTQIEVINQNEGIRQKARICDVVVALTPALAIESTIDYAARFAGRYGAQLIAVYAKPVPAVDLGGYATLPGEYVDRLKEEIDASAVKVRQAFEKIAAREDIKSSWYEGTGEVFQVARQHLRAADVVVVTQPEQSTTETHSWQVNGVILHSGRPVIVVPRNGWSGDIGERQIVAWDGSKEATRAVHDAQFMFDDAAEPVRIVTVPEYEDSREQERARSRAIALATHFSSHGIESVPFTPATSAVPGARAVLSMANADQADLVVMGAWGSTRMREYLFGGMTQSVLAEAQVPVFVSH